MAEGILRALAAERGLPGLRAISAGSAASPGMPPSRLAQDVAREAGIDLSAKRSARLSAEAITGADLILVMEPRHRTDVLNIVPSADERVVLLTDLSPGSAMRGIADPFGGDLAAYRACFGTLRALLTDALPRITARLARTPSPGRQTER
jgi:protein-tyrosine phosphatase